MSVILFALGVALGSFLNVVILRSPEIGQGRGLLNRSRCPHCGQTLRWWELVPIFSFLALGGRCARCQAPISIQYPAVELAMGVAAVALADPILIAIAATLLVLLVIDWRTMLLPDRFIWLLAGLVAVRLVTRQPIGWLEAVAGVGVGAGFLLGLWAASRGRGIGLGDVKLLAPLGALFGPWGAGTLLLLAFWSGGLVALYLLASGRAGLKTAIPFGPFLIGAALLLMLWPTLPEQLYALLWS